MSLSLRLMIFLESRAATSSLSGPHLSAKGLSAHSDIAIIFSETESV